MLEYADAENLPEFLGGKCTEPFPSDAGPWNEYEIVDNNFRKKGTKALEPEESKEEANPLIKSKVSFSGVDHERKDTIRSHVSLNDDPENNEYLATRTAAGTIYYDCEEGFADDFRNNMDGSFIS